MARKLTSTIIDLPIPAEFIERRIYLVQRQKVMLDSDLAELYQVPTKVLNQSVKRNIKRFPNDFMFKLSTEEVSALRSQFVTLDKGRGQHSKYNTLAFTELGIAMLSSVLSSERAVEMNIVIMRAFVKMRYLLTTQKGLAEKVEKIERTQKEHHSTLIAVVRDIQRIKKPTPHPSYWFFLSWIEN